jgi:ABC-type glycerol-3-phosphate transport system substrate-binding protein
MTRPATRRSVLARTGALAAAAGACGLPPPPGARPDATGDGPSPVRIDLLSQWAMGSATLDALQAIIAAFQERYPHITVDYIAQPDGLQAKRLALVAAGTPPTISWDKAVNSLAFADGGALVPVGDYAGRRPGTKPGDGLSVGDWMPGLWDYSRYKGKNWVLPFEISSMVIAYNKELFQRDGVPLPTFEWTWEDFVETALRLTHAERNEWGYANDSATWIFRNWLVGNGGTWYRKQGDRISSVINSPEVVEALRRWSDLWLKHRVASFNSPADGAQQGKIAMWTPCLGVPTYKRWGIDFDQTTIPRMKHFASYWCDKTLFLHTTDTAHQEAGWTFLRFWVSDEPWLDWATETGHLPLTKTQNTSSRWQRHLAENPQYRAHLWAITNGYLFPVPLEPAAAAGQLDAPISAAINAVLKGESAPGPALDDAKAQIDALLAQGIRY